jgi:phage terminase large subunit GpA-like protein
MSDNPPYITDIKWLREQVSKLPTERLSSLISEWAEKKRYMESDVTNRPGPWSNKHVPYAVEIMDCLAPSNPIKEVSWMKAGQIGATTAVLENWIGHTIDEAPAPMLFLTASEDLAKSSIEIYLDRMLQSAGLIDKIRSPNKSRKTGNTTSRKDFRGGFLLTYGAQSTKKLKRVSVQNLAIDEIDEMPAFVGNQGDPIKMARVRQKGFDSKRKTLYLSTPTLTNGPIHKLFKLGDQRYYYVPCKHCGFMQILEFRGTREDGKHYGIYYEVENGHTLLYDSVEYRCKNCLKGWKNYDKYDFLNAGEWRPTIKSKRHLYRSYHSGGEYSPPGAYSWESMVEEWLDCWSEVERRIYDVEALKVFQNTGRGLPYEERGDSPEYEKVVQHRRAIYFRNEIPNKAALKETGSPVLVLTAAADVHKKWIGVEIKGWCRNKGSYSVDWRILEGDTSDLTSSAWEDLRNIISEETWIADDGKKYYVAITLVDAAYRTDTVYEFCGEYSAGVYAIMGRDMPAKTARMSEFNQYNKKGITAFNVTVTRYKDRVSAWLRKDWNDGELQPIGYPNYPADYGDDYFRQYEAEEKKKKINKRTGQTIGYVWMQKPNAANHAWDCAVYNAAALDMICYDINLNYLGKDEITYPAFWNYISEESFFYISA